MDSPETLLPSPKAEHRTFTIPKFDKKLHEAKHNNWDCIFHLSHFFELAPEGTLQAGILDIDRFSIYVIITGTDKKVWLSKSSVVCTEILEP